MMSLLSSRVSSFERRRDPRHSACGLEALYSAGLTRKRFPVKNISSTGLYLSTNERMLPGSKFQLTLQREGVVEADDRNRVSLEATSVRWGSDGMGLSIVPADIDTTVWLYLMKGAVRVNRSRDEISSFRFARAATFLIRACTHDLVRVLELMANLSNQRAERLIRIIFQAEELLGQREMRAGFGSLPTSVYRVLEVGSRTADDKSQRLWAGLLATALLDGPREDANVKYVEAFAQLAPMHVHLLAAACNKALERGWSPGFTFRESLQFGIEELQRISGVQDIGRIERSLYYLNDLRLLYPNARRDAFAEVKKLSLTPTAFALHLHARCRGFLAADELVTREEEFAASA